MREEDTMYWVKDGLKYCKVCGKPKEAYFPAGGFMGMKIYSTDNVPVTEKNMKKSKDILRKKNTGN